METMLCLRCHTESGTWAPVSGENYIACPACGYRQLDPRKVSGKCARHNPDGLAGVACDRCEAEQAG